MLSGWLTCHFSTSCITFSCAPSYHALSLCPRSLASCSHPLPFDGGWGVGSSTPCARRTHGTHVVRMWYARCSDDKSCKDADVPSLCSLSIFLLYLFYPCLAASLTHLTPLAFTLLHPLPSFLCPCCWGSWKQYATRKPYTLYARCKRVGTQSPHARCQTRLLSAPSNQPPQREVVIFIDFHSDVAQKAADTGAHSVVPPPLSLACGRP